MDHAYFLAPFLLPFPKKEEVNERKKRMISSFFLPSSRSPQNGNNVEEKEETKQLDPPFPLFSLSKRRKEGH